ncbi:MAG: TolC family protein [Spirochaetaceae bacterium]
MKKRTTTIVSIVACLLLAPALWAEEREVDLRSFLELVETNSLDLERARTDRSLAEVQEQLARTQLYPNIAGQLGYNRNLLDIEQQLPIGAIDTGDGSGFYPLQTEEMDVSNDNEFTMGFSLQQNIFDMTVFRALEASEQFTSLTGTAFEVARQSILTEAKRLFYQTLLLQEVLEVRRSSEENARDNYQETQRRFENGVASRLEVLRAEVNWKITQPDTTQAERNLQVALQNMKNLAGLPQEVALSLRGDLERFPELPRFALPSEVQGSRPDYQLLLNEQRLRELNVDAQRAAFYPSLSASANYGWQAASDEWDLSDPTDTLALGLSMTIPVFYGGSRFATLEQAKLEVRQVNTQIAQKQSDIYTELENIRLTLQEANQRIDSARQTLNTAEEAYNVTESSVESGLATQLELKDARVSLEAARLSYLSAVFDYLSSYFEWQRATGRGDQLPG